MDGNVFTPTVAPDGLEESIAPPPGEKGDRYGRRNSGAGRSDRRALQINQHRIDELEADNKALHQLATSVEVLATKQETIESNVNEIKTDVKALKALPGSRWEGLIKAAVTAIVAGLVGYALALAGLGG